MTTSLLQRRDHVVRSPFQDDVLAVEPERAGRSAWVHVAVAGAVVAAVVTTGAVTWDGDGPDGVGAGVEESGTGPQGLVPHPMPGPVARPVR